MHLLKGVFYCLHAEIALIQNDTYNKSSDIKSDKPIKKAYKNYKTAKSNNCGSAGGAIPQLQTGRIQWREKINKLEKTKI